MTNLKHPILVGLLLLAGGFGLAYILGNTIHLPFSSLVNEILKLIPVTIAVVGGVTIFLHFARGKK